jgi:predicted enzyme related to lactoylglutathione lyase
MTVNLYRVIIPVKNIETATSFYSHVLKESGERVSPGRHYYDCDGTTLACYDPIAEGDDVGKGWKHHFNQYVYFAVSDLDHVESRVREAGGEIDTAIETMPWGERMFYAKDPFGNPISFVDQDTVYRGTRNE